MRKLSGDPRIDDYIDRSAEFARPILEHMRRLIHLACPDVVEEIKWRHPFFLHRGVILCNVAAFKAHCSFGFWGAEIRKVLKAEGVAQEGGMASLGRLLALTDLPPDARLLNYLRQAAAFIESGKGETMMAARRSTAKAPRPAMKTPAEFDVALKKNEDAARNFQAFSPSCRREYVDWIVEAKRPVTRARRIAQAVQWLEEGKKRNWKYEEC